MTNNPIYHTKGQRCIESKNEMLIIQVIDSSDLKCVKEKINMAKLKNGKATKPNVK